MQFIMSLIGHKDTGTFYLMKIAEVQLCYTTTLAS